MSDLPKLDGPRAAPKSRGKPEQLVVFLHGYGADGNDLIGLAGHLRAVLPEASYVSPHAPFPCDMSPMGRQWFPISRLSPDEMWTGVQQAAPALNAFLDDELEQAGLTDNDLILIGFSQGTMLALHAGLRRASPPRGIVGFSGALAGPDHLSNDITCKPPVLLVHGDADEVVPFQALYTATNTLEALDVPVEWHVSQGLGHGIGPDGLQKAMEFLTKIRDS